jgi:hypothetical protein
MDVVRAARATLTSSAARPVIDVTPIPAHAYRGIELFTLVTTTLCRLDTQAPYRASHCLARQLAASARRTHHQITQRRPKLLADTSFSCAFVNLFCQAASLLGG